MSEMIERIARAMVSSFHGWRPPSLSESEWQMLARVAIRALREPTRDMKLAANKVPIERYGWAEFAVTGYEAEDIWNAMIDAALGEGT